VWPYETISTGNFTVPRVWSRDYFISILGASLSVTNSNLCLQQQERQTGLMRCQKSIPQGQKVIIMGEGRHLPPVISPVISQHIASRTCTPSTIYIHFKLGCLHRALLPDISFIATISRNLGLVREIER